MTVVPAQDKRESSGLSVCVKLFLLFEGEGGCSGLSREKSNMVNPM